MYQTDELQKKWQPVLEHADLPEIDNAHKRSTVATLLENQERNAMEQAAQSGGAFRPSLLGEAAPANATGASVDNFDPVLIAGLNTGLSNEACKVCNSFDAANDVSSCSFSFLLFVSSSASLLF